jgi:DNA-binding Lrp family transcriptional regulator
MKNEGMQLPSLPGPILEQLLRETRVSLTQLAKGQNVSVPTCWRWTQRGVKNHVLASFSCGGRKFTTQQAFRRWVAAINGECIANGETPRQRELAIDRAEQRAKQLGV